MNPTSGVLLCLAGGIAVTDWIAVGRGHERLEYLAKPGAMVALIAATLALDLDPGVPRVWFVAALVLSLVGDVFLMLPRDLFVPGLASFLLGHVAYIVGLLQFGASSTGLVLALVVVAVALPTLGRRILGAVRSGSEPALLGPVAVYIAAISAMVVAAGRSGQAVAVAGALSFYVSDAAIAWHRFVSPFRAAPVLIIVTYHLAQVGLALSLV